MDHVGYGGVAQFFPGVFLGLYSKRVTASGVFAGLLTGVFLFVALTAVKRDPLMGLSAGFIALCCNAAVVAAVSLLRPAERSGFDEQPQESAN